MHACLHARTHTWPCLFNWPPGEQQQPTSHTQTNSHPFLPLMIEKKPQPKWDGSGGMSTQTNTRTQTHTHNGGSKMWSGWKKEEAGGKGGRQRLGQRRTCGNRQDELMPSPGTAHLVWLIPSRCVCMCVYICWSAQGVSSHYRAGEHVFSSTGRAIHYMSVSAGCLVYRHSACIIKVTMRIKNGF